MASRTYTAAIIGCGRIAGALEQDPLRQHPCTHMGAYRRFPQIKVIACSGKSTDSAKEFAGQWDIPRYYDNYLEMLDREGPDIVSVCTPAWHHHDAVIDAARRGARAIFCEKAIAASLEEADKMISECRSHGAHLTVNHTRRWCWDFQAVKKTIDAEELGRLQSITGWFSGSLVHTGTHFFDVVNYFCGPCRSVRAAITEDRRNNESALEDGDGYALMEMENGVRVIVNGVSKSYYIFEIELMFDEGRIRIGNGVHQLWRSGKSKQYEDFDELSKDAFPDAPSGEKNPLVLAVRDIIGGLEDDRETLSTGEDARHALEMAFAIFASHERGGNAVAIPMTERGVRIASK